MSDVFEGPGWWMASDGLWYPSAQHPDSNYRSHFASEDVKAAVTPAQVAETPLAFEQPLVEQLGDSSGSPVSDVTAPLDVRVDVTAPITFPGVSVEETQKATTDGEQSGFGDLARASVRQPYEESPPLEDPAAWAQTGEIRLDLVDLTDAVERESSNPEAPEVIDLREASETVSPERVSPERVSPERTSEVPPTSRAVPPTPAVSVGRAEPLTVEPRPSFRPSIPPSVVRAPGDRSAVEIELGRTDADRARIRTEPTITEPGPASTSLELVPVEQVVYFPPGPTRMDRSLAALAFIAGASLIVGTFLPWLAGAESQAGWERPDGIVAAIAGLLGAAASGPLWIGYRRLIPLLLTVAGIVGTVIGAIAAVRIISDGDGSISNVGAGLVIVLASSLALIFTGLASREARAE